MYVRLIKVNGIGLLLINTLFLDHNMKEINPKISNYLVWCSVLLLGIFLLYWNVSEYESRKKDLVFDMENQLALAESMYNDSLFRSIMSYVRDDSLDAETFRAEIIAISDAYRGDSSIINVSANFEDGIDSISLFISENLMQIGPSDSTNKTIKFDVSTNYYEQLDRLPNKQNLNHFRVHDSLDFVQHRTINALPEIENLFKSNLRKNNLPDSIQLVAGEDLRYTSALAISLPEHFGKPADHKSSMLVFEYKHYLMKKTLPGILLSVLLFFLVLYSFVTILSAWKKQNSLSNMKNQFISNMTHELKTPISTISVALEALGQYGAINDPNKRAEYIQMSKHEVNRLNILIDKVMQMSFLESGNIELEFEKVDLGILVESLLAALKLHFEEHNVIMSFVKVGFDFTINADKINITNLLYNLIDNSIKYTEGDPEIEIKISEHQNKIELSITDNGIGIDKKHQSQIFDRFYRIAEDDVHNVKGYGIGLHYVADIVAKHQGEIAVHSALGDGTQIIIKLPKQND